MILLFTEPEVLETVSCSQCGRMVSVACTGIIDSLPKLRSLLDGSLNTATCETCGVRVTAEEPVWVNLEAHGIAPLFYMPLSYVERGYFPPEILADPDEAGRIYYGLEELARQVRARIVIHRLSIGV